MSYEIKPRSTIFIWLGLGLLLLVLIVHLAAVQVLRSQFEAFLHPEEGQGTYLGDVHLNLFSGLLSISGVEVRQKGQVHLQASQVLIDIDPLALFQKRVHVQQLQLVGGLLRVERLEDGSLHALVPLPADSEAKPEEKADPGIGVISEQLSVRRFTIEYVDALAGSPELLRLEELDVRGPLQVERQALDFALDAAWRNAGLQAEGKAEIDGEPVVAARLTLQQLPLHKAFAAARMQPLVEAEIGARFDIQLAQQQLKADGELQLKDLNWQEGEQQLALAAFNGKTLQLQLPLQSPADILLQGGALNADDLVFAQGDTQAQLANMRTQGQWRLDLAAQTFDLLDVVISTQQLQAVVAGQTLQLESSQSQLSAEQAPLSQPSLRGTSQVSGIEIQAPQIGTDTFRVATLDLASLQLDGDRVKLGKLNTKQLGFSQFPFSIGELSLSNAAIDPKTIALGQVTVSDLRGTLRREGKGAWQLPLVETSPGSSVEEEAAAQEPVAFRLGGVKVAGDSRIRLLDASIEPAIDRDIRIKRFELGALDSLATGQNTPVKVTLIPDEYTALEIDGTLRPFAKDLYLKLDGQLSGMELALVNGLIRDDLGHRFLGGHLDNGFDLHIEKRKLTMNNELKLQDLNVEAIEGKDGPPLSTAIALLEDKNGRIEVGVPISGDLDDPDFKVLGALNPIIGKAVAGAAALAIQPLGTVLLVGGLLASEAMEVRFDPALFEAKTAELQNADKLRQLAGILKEKPKLSLRFCGLAVEADRTKNKKGEYVETEEQLLALAEQRVEKVRTLMLAEGVAEKQLRSCRPLLEKMPEAKPRVAIRL